MSGQVDTLYAFLGETLVGAFRRDAQGAISFTYDEGYRWGAASLPAKEPTPLSPSLPLERGTVSGQAPKAFLEALIPESPTAREQVRRLHKAASGEAFDLLAAIGLDATGALRLSLSDALPSVPDELIAISDEEIEQRLREAAPIGGQPAGVNEHWSVAGQQGKIALCKRPSGWFVSTGIARTTHILKPGVPGLPDQAFDEHFTMSIARHMGLNVSETDFAMFGSTPAVIATRFDRRIMSDGSVRAFHQVDFTQALGVDADQKYEEYGGLLAERYALMLREHDVYGESESNVRGFADGIMASYLLGATDSHAKNYSLLLDGAHVTLAPLYDFASVFPYLASKARGISLTLAMTIGGQRKLLQLRAEHLHRFADRMGLDQSAVVDRFATLIHAMPDAFDEAVEENRGKLGLLTADGFVDDFRARMQLTLDDAAAWLR